jgi:hypothetical protein
MRTPPNTVVLRLLAKSAFVVVVGVVAVLSKPEWIEFFAEAGSFLAVVLVIRNMVVKIRTRFGERSASPFERALRRERLPQKPPSQLLTAISMAASPDKATFELLAAAADDRLRDRHGFGLNDEKARDILGTEVYELLQRERSSGPSWAVRKTSGGWRASIQPIARTFRRLSLDKFRKAHRSQPSALAEETRVILNSLEQL